MKLDDLNELANRPLTHGDRAWIAFCSFLSVFVAGGLVMYLARWLYWLIF